MKCNKLNLCNYIYFVITILLYFAYPQQLMAQPGKKLDSLDKAYKSSGIDTSKAIILSEMADILRYMDPDTALTLSQKGLSLSQKIKFKKGEALNLFMIGAIKNQYNNFDTAIIFCNKSLKISEEIQFKFLIARNLNLLALCYSANGNNALALEYHFRALGIRTEIQDSKGMTASYNNIAIIYANQGNYTNSLDYYLKSLRISEKLNDSINIAACYNNIAAIYLHQYKLSEALDYCLKALNVYENMKNIKMISFCYNNIAQIYLDQDKDSLALEYNLKSLNLKRKINDQSGIANSYQNIAEIYQKRQNYTVALEYLFKSLKITEELNDQDGIATTCQSISRAFFKQENLTDALRYAKKSFEISKGLNSYDLVNQSADMLYNIYKIQNNFKDALFYHEEAKAANDSMVSVEKNKKLEKLQFGYEIDKKKNEIEILEKDKKIALQNERTQRLYTMFFAVGFALLFLLVFVIFRSRQQAHRANFQLIAQKAEILRKNTELQKLNEEITAQRDDINEKKKIIENKNKNITDSIRYAKRIQDAMLPSATVLDEHIKNHFILFRPRDIVSGDFYWMKYANDLLYVVAADCTGHGVPGAFMSMLGISLLNEIILKNEYNRAHLVLNQLRSRIKESLHQTGMKNETQDGMDIALCIFDFKNHKVNFAGAYNPLIILRQCDEVLETDICKDGFILREVKANRMPIGIHPKDYESFTNIEVELKPKDRLYIFSDGYVSQSGGPKNDKLKISRLKDALLEVQLQPMTEQYNSLNSLLDSWMGKLEQVDDILVIGLEINLDNNL